MVQIQSNSTYPCKHIVLKTLCMLDDLACKNCESLWCISRNNTMIWKWFWEHYNKAYAIQKESEAQKDKHCHKQSRWRWKFMVPCIANLNVLDRVKTHLWVEVDSGLGSIWTHPVVLKARRGTMARRVPFPLSRIPASIKHSMKLLCVYQV